MPNVIIQSLLTVLVTAGLPAGLATGIASVLTYAGTSRGHSVLTPPKGRSE